MPRGVREPIEIRFWQSVDKTGDCWLWTAAHLPAGYGMTFVRGKNQLAHRVAWELTNGVITEGAWVLHRCDNPACVNPDHLYLGNRSRNMKDAHERSRIDLKRVASFPRPGRRKQARY